MKIVQVASEVYPFSKTGGLADVVYALSKYQKKLKNDVYVISPLYKGILEKFPEISDTGRKTWVETNEGTFEFNIFAHKKERVNYIFLSNLFLFERGGYYGKNGVDYKDNYLVFGAFSKAALNVIRHYIKGADIVHCHDWQTALIPSLLKTEYPDIGAKSVFTIHNIAFQGLFEFSKILNLRIDLWLCGLECLEFYGKANFMKSAIVMCDAFTTVSPTYADQIQTAEFGFGLENVIKRYNFKLKGILNGLDYTIWNPKDDKYLYKNYSLRNFSEKFENKKFLCKTYGFNEKLPLFGFVSRFTEQKGVDLIVNTIDKFENKANFILLGDTNNTYMQELLYLNKFENIAVEFGFKEKLSRLIYAASDFYMMPSRFEPCGISQLIAMSYGDIPVVRSTGGLKDTIIDIKDGGNGIMFEEYSRGTFMEALNRGVNIYHSSDFLKICKKNYKIRFTWENCAIMYQNIYNKIISQEA
jgi:starch synthase